MRTAYMNTAIAIATILALAACGRSEPQSIARAGPHAAGPQTPTPSPRSMAPATTSLSSDRLNAVVDRLLRSQYPEGFDAAHQCWKAHYGEGDQEMAYCMRGLPASAVTERGQQVIYFAAASAADIEGVDSYRYGAIDPGMFDAFRAVVAPDGAATIAASGKGMDFGSAGACGCVDADLVQLGPDVHGWTFSSGSTQQGVTTATHSLIAPLGSTFKDVAGIPQYVEDEPDVEYRMAIGSEGAKEGWFPLTVSKYRGDRKLASHVVHFDTSQKRYLMPQSF